nr:hypothetical protein [Tanacetum cinerariifolium]
MAGLKSSWEHGQQCPVIIIDGKEMAFRNFMYAETDDDLTFLPKGPSLEFGTGSPSISINTKPPIAKAWPTGKESVEKEGILQSLLSSASWFKGLPLQDLPVRRLLLRKMTRSLLFQMMIKISAITPSTWKNHLDNQLDVELLDLHDRCYARQAVLDNAVNRRSRQLLKADPLLVAFDTQLKVFHTSLDDDASCKHPKRDVKGTTFFDSQIKLIIVTSYRNPIQMLVAMPFHNLEFCDSNDSSLGIYITSRFLVNDETVELLTFTPLMGDST